MFTDLNRIPLSLEIGSYTSEILNWGYIEPAPWRNYLHTHSCFEVCHVFAGQGIFHIQDRDHQVI